jgi:hypothetical protein
VGRLDTYIPDGAPFKPTADLPGINAVDGVNHLCYQLYFEAGVIEGSLTFRLTYSGNLFTERTIDRLANDLLQAIEESALEIG